IYSVGYGREARSPQIGMTREKTLMQLRAEELTEKAREGDREAIFEILQDFIGATEQRTEKNWNGHIEYKFAAFLADSFEKILNGIDPGKALGLKTSKAGRKPGTQFHDPEVL